jgi:hypothetical protein
MAEIEEIYEDDQDEVEEELDIEDAAIDEDEGEPEDKAESEDSDEIIVAIDGEEPPASRRASRARMGPRA